MKAFKGLTPEDFAAYSPEKWSSNVHNLPRMRVKDLMLSLCDHASSALTAELEGLTRAASDEVPNIVNHKKVDAQWVYWYRDAAAREGLASFLEKTPLVESKLFDIAPQDKHIILTLVLRQTDLWVGLRVAPGAVVDRRNLSAMLGKAWEREQWLEQLRELPDGAVIGLDGALKPVAEVNANSLADFAGQLGSEHPVWHLGHTISAEDAIALGTDLPDHISRWLGALAPHYRFVAWTKKNDHIEVTKQLQEEKAQKRRQALGYNRGDRVRVISGVFSGKVGVVQDIDTKAQVRVLVGKLSVVVPGTDLTPAT